MEIIVDILGKLYKINHPVFRKILEKLILKIDGGGYFYSLKIRELYAIYYGLHIGYGSYGGCFVHENFPGPCNITFGRYCSIGSHVCAFRANHPSDKFTTHPFLYNPVLGYVEKDMLERPELNIGNDVWIGSRVIICPGVMNIGDGAIIGAGSVVTHDVEPYTIVAGNPAKVIRKRFNEDQIKYLQDSKWWELSYAELQIKEEEINSRLRELSE